MERPRGRHTQHVVRVPMPMVDHGCLQPIPTRITSPAWKAGPEWLHPIMIFQTENAGLVQKNSPYDGKSCCSEHTFLQWSVLFGLFDQVNNVHSKPSQ